MKASESAREAAMRLLDQQAIRFHKDGTFRDWDNTVQAFAQAEARGRKEAAEAYGQHQASCDRLAWWVENDTPCTCGLDSLLSLIPGEPA